MITELDHICNIPIGCEGKEYVPAILLSVNKMVAIVGDIWQHLTSLVGVMQLGFRVLLLWFMLICRWETQVGGLEF